MKGNQIRIFLLDPNYNENRFHFVCVIFYDLRDAKALQEKAAKKAAQAARAPTSGGGGNKGNINKK